MQMRNVRQPGMVYLDYDLNTILLCKRQLSFESHADENLSHLSTF